MKAKQQQSSCIENYYYILVHKSAKIKKAKFSQNENTL